MKKLTSVVAVAFALLVISSTGVFAQVGDPASVAGAFNAAALDPAAETGMVTDDITIKVLPPPPGTQGIWTGKTQAAGFFQFVKGQNVHRELVGNWQVNGDTVSGTVMVTNNDFAKWNVGAVQHQLEFVVQDGKIKSFTSIMAPSERARVQTAAQAYQATQSTQAPAPGMPRTGVAEDTRSVLLVLLGLAMCLLAGGGLVRRARPNR